MTDERLGRASVLLIVLAVVQLLHGLDLLRTDDEATLAEVLTAPQGLAGIGGALLGAFALHRRWANGRFVATLAASLIAVGFVVVHGVPWKNGATDPYWGDGSADALEWLGVLVILALCGWILALLRPAERLTAPAART